MRYILSRLIDLTWYWFVGYRFGDADGTAKLRYLIRWCWSQADLQRPSLERDAIRQ